MTSHSNITFGDIPITFGDAVGSHWDHTWVTFRTPFLIAFGSFSRNNSMTFGLR